MEADVARMALMYFVMPVWLLAGFADYRCHRAAHIESTSGPKESLLHLLLLVEMGIPVLAALFFEINALVIGVMIVCFLLHEATTLWDVWYASETREVSPIEQHVHGYMQLLPLLALTLVSVLHWPQFLALFGLGPEAARFELTLRQQPLPWLYVTSLLGAVALLDVLPFIEELLRGLRAQRLKRSASASTFVDPR
jgi:hypothetical protein